VKENLKPYAYKQREHYLKCDLVLFVERASELRYAARLSDLNHGAAGKPSLNRAKLSCMV